MSTAVSNSVQELNAGDGMGGDNNSAHLSQIVSFRLAREEYGLDIMGVQEIILLGEITEIPEVPAYVRGLINLRGKIIPIVDLRKRFGLEAGDPTEHTRIIVFNSGGDTFGIVVDAVNEVLRLEPDKIEPPPKGVVGINSAYIKGLVKMEERIMILLDSERIMSSSDQATISNASSDQSCTQQTGGEDTSSD